MEDFLARARRFGVVDGVRFPSEERFASWVDELRSRGRVSLALFDSRGRTLSSEELAQGMETAGVDGLQHLVYAIGPADGWSDATKRSADQLIAFGRMTLPHELALAVAAEQIYRALAIQNHHPYHSGH